MTTRRIPESAYPAIQSLIRFRERDFESFLDALSKAEPSLNKRVFWSHVAKHVKGIDPTLIEAILREIFTMEDSRGGDEEISEFIDSIVEAAAEVKSQEFPFQEKDGEILKNRLLGIFDGRKGLDITMKAMGVVLDHHHLFFHAKILTDIRPVFNTKGDSIDAAVIVHNLRIHYEEDSEHKDFYVALDTSDIQLLREALDRAEAKAKCLQGLVKTSGVPFLEVEE